MTFSIAVFSPSVIPVNVVTPWLLAYQTRCSSNSVAIPLWCIRSATANATSASLWSGPCPSSAS